jgi:hypothetical protein
VEACSVVLSSSAVLFLAANLAGQGATSPWITGLLPPEAKVIETADLKVGGRNSRGLVLWMLHPTRVVRRETGGLGCADWVYGDHWYGPTRLSLFDVTNKKLINTIEIRGMYEGAEEKDHGFPIPFLVQNGSYYVPQGASNKEGAPMILNLRDLTGEGVAGQFVLFEYEACAISLTTVLGYSPKSDRAVQYGVERVTESGKPEVVSWVEQVFGAKPLQPGRWDFTWQPGHGAEGSVREQVSFDQKKQVFVQE